MNDRWIIHVDMDAFYASIEEREDPSLKGKPLVVAKDPRKTGGRGVVSTANYIARRYGVHSAMSSSEALKLCPAAIFRFSGFQLYRAVSQQIHNIFHHYTDTIESYALDEAYLDVTNNKLGLTDPIQIGREIQQKIKQVTKLTCSIGISYNKFLAKEASDYTKPAGFTIISANDAPNFLAHLPIEKFRGVGKKTVPKMKELGINNGTDLLKLSELDLMKHFGKFGYVLYRRARGIDERPVEASRIRKSIGRERTFGPVLDSEAAVRTQLRLIATQVVKDVVTKHKHGKTLVLKVRYQDFQTVTKRATFLDYIDNDIENYLEITTELLEELPEVNAGVRLLGITLTSLDDLNYENLALNLF